MPPSNSKPAATRGFLATDPTGYWSHGWRTTYEKLIRDDRYLTPLSGYLYALQVMQILSFRITPIIATVCFTFAIPAAFADQPVYGVPTGSTINVTTPDPTLVKWPGESKLHHQIRADQTYTAESINLYPNGFKFDPHGAIGIRRFFQTRVQGTYSLGTPSEINVLTKDMPANSRFNQAQYIQDFGPYAPDESTFSPTSLAANDAYGVETIALVFVDGNNNQTVLDYQKIDIYPPLYTPDGIKDKRNAAAFFDVQNFQSKTALNTTNSYAGDPPRVIMRTNTTIYPGAQTWVVMYSGNSQPTPPANAKKIDYTTATAPPGDVSGRDSVYIDVGNFVSGPGTYTLQVIESSVYGTEVFGNPASFTISNKYNVNSQFGLVK